MRGRLKVKMLGNQRGATAVLVGLCLFALVGFGALAVDIGHLCVAKNELQNGADAGALAGARFLYEDNGTSINAGAAEIARDAAMANMSEGVAVEVNAEDVEIGHWSFATKTFTAGSPPFEVPNLWEVSTAELDADPTFINAVRVVARRQATPIASFLARIFGHESFEGSADAVGYIGFAGTLFPGEVDQPIAICKDSLLDDGDAYTCTVGRMINSGVDETTNETGGWTSFNQDDPCSGGTNADELGGLVCADGNPESIILGEVVATNGGDIQSVFDAFIDCWVENTSKTQPWPLVLPVIECGDDNNVGTCEVPVGAVEINVVWITGGGTDPHYSDAPTQMGDWSNDDPDGHVRWDDFVSHFNLQNADGSPAPYIKKSIYFQPDCTPHAPAGNTGGANFGILAEIPVLVE
jgi:Flp pilus assembly protein TadG